MAPQPAGTPPARTGRALLTTVTIYMCCSFCTSTDIVFYTPPGCVTLAAHKAKSRDGGIFYVQTLTAYRCLQHRLKNQNKKNFILIAIFILIARTFHFYFYFDRAPAGASALTRGVGLSPGARNATQAASSRARTVQ